MRTVLRSGSALVAVAAVTAALVGIVALPAQGQEPAAPPAAAPPAPTPAGAPSTLPIRRVILSTSGLAHFEHQGTVGADTDLTLSVRLDQVDDLLKSLVVYDPQGTIAGVSLPGRAPLIQAFRDLPFTPAEIQDPVALMNALQGASVEVTGSVSAAGRLVRVVPEQVQAENGATVTRHRLTILTGQGLQQVVLQDLTSLKFTDATVQSQIDRALDAILANRAQDSRTLSVALRGPADREVAMAYVVGAPLWKAAYRLVLPAAETAASAPAPGALSATEGMIQGWAVMENMSGQDWTDVELTLVSGNPVTYRQQLYTAYYADRPEVPVEVFGRVLPRIDDGAIPGDQFHEMAEMDAGDGAGYAQNEVAQRLSAQNTMRSMARPAAPPMSAPVPTMAMAGMADAVVATSAPGARTFATGAQAAASEEATTQVLFRFPEPVTVAAGHSLMVPFVSGPVPVERVALFQPETHPRHPLMAVRVRNDGTSGLPPGILTLYEQGEGVNAFVGDAQMPILQRGESRLVSYALDSKTIVDNETTSESLTRSVVITDGVARVTLTERSMTRYVVKAPAEEPRRLLIEHARPGGDWQIVSPPADRVEVTESHYRVPLEVAAGATGRVDVVLEQPVVTQISLFDYGADWLLAQATSWGKLRPELAAALTRAADLRRAVDAAERQLARIDQETARITEEQDRLRQNLNSVGQSSDLGRRYLTKLNDQETQLERLQTDRTQADTALTAARETLRQYLANLDV